MAKTKAAAQEEKSEETPEANSVVEAATEKESENQSSDTKLDTSSKKEESSEARMQKRITNVWEAKLHVMKKVPYVYKKQPEKGSNKGLTYSYASEAELIRQLHPAFIEVGLTIAPINAEPISVEPYPSKSGGLMQHTRVKMTYRLTHAWSKTWEDIVVWGESADVGDKSSPKAMTIGLKYALRQAFLIETGDVDPDAYAPEQYEQGDPTSGPMGSTYLNFKGALESAGSLEELEKLGRFIPNNANRKRNFNAVQQADLTSVYFKQKKALETKNGKKV